MQTVLVNNIYRPTIPVVYSSAEQHNTTVTKASLYCRPLHLL